MRVEQEKTQGPAPRERRAEGGAQGGGVAQGGSVAASCDPSPAAPEGSESGSREDLFAGFSDPALFPPAHRSTRQDPGVKGALGLDVVALQLAQSKRRKARQDELKRGRVAVEKTSREAAEAEERAALAVTVRILQAGREREQVMSRQKLRYSGLEREDRRYEDREEMKLEFERSRAAREASADARVDADRRYAEDLAAARDRDRYRDR